MSDDEFLRKKETLTGGQKKVDEYVDLYFDKGVTIESHQLDDESSEQIRKAIQERYEIIKILMEHPKNIEYAERMSDGENIQLDSLPNNIRYAVRYLMDNIQEKRLVEKREAIQEIQDLEKERLLSLIPVNYRKFPIELIEDFWDEPIRVDDPTHGRAFIAKKRYVLKVLENERKEKSRQDELNRVRESLIRTNTEDKQKDLEPIPFDSELAKEESLPSDFVESLEISLNQKIELDPNVERLSSQETFGDSNGSYQGFVEHLQSRSLITIEADGELTWIGGTTRATFLGDILGDRTPEGQQIYTALMKLKNSAVEQGGNITWLAGNHDNMYNAMLFGFTTENGVSVESDMKNRLTSYIGNFESAQYLSNSEIDNYFNDEDVQNIIEQLMNGESEIHQVIEKRKKIVTILENNPDVSRSKIESFASSVEVLKQSLAHFQNLFNNNFSSSQEKMVALVNLGAELPKIALLRLGQVILDNRESIIQNIKESNPLLLEGIYNQKLVTIEDDILHCHTNLTVDMIELIESQIPSGGTFAQGIEKINLFYQSVLRWYGSSPKIPEKLSDDQISYFNKIRNEFISTSKASRVNYSENTALSADDITDITKRMKGYGINAVLHGHNDENGEKKGTNDLPILSIDRSAYKGSEGISNRPIATASVGTDGMMSYF